MEKHSIDHFELPGLMWAVLALVLMLIASHRVNTSITLPWRDFIMDGVSTKS
jgi:hypothetical protein